MSQAALDWRHKSHVGTHHDTHFGKSLLIMSLVSLATRECDYVNKHSSVVLWICRILTVVTALL